MVVIRAFGVQDLYEAAEQEIVAVLYHPFTLSSLAGTLSQSCLTNFLRDEAFVLSAAASLSTRQQTKALLLKHAEKLSIHQDGKDEVSDSAKSMTSFMMQQQAADDECKALVTLMAILHLRVFLEKTVCKYIDEKSNLWIGGYGQPDFQACASLVEEESESLFSQRIIAPKRQSELQHVFKALLTQQLRVLSSAYSGRKEAACSSSNPWHPVNLLFTTDYDVTCTARDTSEILVSVAQKNSRSGSSNLEDCYWKLMKAHDDRIKDCLSLWEYGSVSAKLTPVSEKRSRLCHLIPGMDLGLRPYVKDLQDQLANPESFYEYENSNFRSILKTLGDLEKKINKEVMEAGLLKGVRRKQVREEVKRIPLLPRCSEFLQQLSGMNTPIHYISASWSRDLITGGLPTLPEGHLFVHSNDLEYSSDEVSIGSFRGVVENAFDKEAILHALRRMYNAYPEEQKRAVFVGDSTNDLLVLLDADLGIVMGQNPALREMLVRFNLQLLPLAVAAAHVRSSVESEQAKSYRHSGVLFEASGWAELEACLLNNT